MPPRDDEIDRLLEETLLCFMREPEDHKLQQSILGQRRSGLTLFALASACILSPGLLPAPWRDLGSMLLLAASILLLFVGGWLLDLAGKQEIKAYRSRLGDLLVQTLVDAEGVFVMAKIRKKQYFGRGLLVLAAFAMAVVAAPLPGKGSIDMATWGTYSVLLLNLGAWKLLQATREEVDALKAQAAAERRAAVRSTGRVRIRQVD
jgi:hypothetical protein